MKRNVFEETKQNFNDRYQMYLHIVLNNSSSYWYWFYIGRYESSKCKTVKSIEYSGGH